MGTTTNGLPYPEPTDPVAQGAAAIRSLAESIDTKVAAIKTGTTAIRSGSAVGTTDGAGDVKITFPTPFPAGANVFVVATNGDPTNSAFFVMGPWAPTNANFWVRCKTLTGGILASTAVRITYIASSYPW